MTWPWVVLILGLVLNFVILMWAMKDRREDYIERYTRPYESRTSVIGSKEATSDEFTERSL